MKVFDNLQSNYYYCYCYCYNYYYYTLHLLVPGTTQHKTYTRRRMKELGVWGHNPFLLGDDYCGDLQYCTDVFMYIIKVFGNLRSYYCYYFSKYYALRSLVQQNTKHLLKEERTGGRNRSGGHNAFDSKLNSQYGGRHL
jgi:hypothetical protein